MKRSEYLEQYTGIDPAADMALHRKYYAQFVSEGVRDSVGRAIGVDRIMASTDPHLNDIPLKAWDALHCWIAWLCGEYAKHNCISMTWALSDSVCVAKEAARQIKEAGE